MQSEDRQKKNEVRNNKKKTKNKNKQKKTMKLA